MIYVGLADWPPAWKKERSVLFTVLAFRNLLQIYVNTSFTLNLILMAEYEFCFKDIKYTLDISGIKIFLFAWRRYGQDTARCSLFLSTQLYATLIFFMFILFLPK